MTALSTTAGSPVKAVKANWQYTTTVNKLGDSVQIWAIELRDSPRYLCSLKRWLSVSERDRANRILIPNKRDYQIQSKAWLRWLLAGYTGSSVKKINYQFGQLGKPYLGMQPASIQFNATDSGNILLVAFHQSYELGLDIEAVPRNVNYRGIAKRKLTENEISLLLSLPEADQSDAFLALWTRKESYGKAMGLGIRYPMNKVNTCDDLAKEYHVIQNNGNQDWHLLQIADSGFIACLTSSNAVKRIHFYKLNLDAMSFDDV